MSVNKKYIIFVFTIMHLISFTKQKDCDIDVKFLPKEYVIKLAMDFPERQFHGNVKINGTVKEETSEIRLDSMDRNIHTVNVSMYSQNLEQKSAMEIKNILLRKHNFKITLAKALVVNQTYEIEIDYTGKIGNYQEKGIFGHAYKTKEGRDSYFIATEFQTNFAHTTFPCIDRPSFKAKYTLSVTRPPHFTSISNTMLKETSLPDEKYGGQVWDTFAETPVMSTYTVVLVIGEFVGVKSDRNNTVWVERGQEALAEYPSKLAPTFIQVMEKITGVSYTLDKLDHIALPYLKSVAMENWGAITYKDEFLLYNAETASVVEELTVIITIAHEIIHQWFGNLVTCKSWSYAWLNEGVTSYLQYVVTSKVFPQWEMVGLLLFEEAYSVMDDEGYTPIALSNEICGTEYQYFTLDIYYKGASVMRMVQHLVSEEIMLESLSLYLKANQFKSVGEEDLWNSINENEAVKAILPQDTSLAKIMKTWTHNSGYPLLKVQRCNDSVILTQEQLDFFKPIVIIEKWWIPLTYTSSRKPNFHNTTVKGWLRADADSLKLNVNLAPDEWIIFNLRHAGYYRINYDQLTWELLTDHLLKGDMEKIDPINRARLLDDSFTLARFKKLSYTTALNLSKFLEKENHYYSWNVAIKQFTDIRISLRNSPTRALFEKYILKLIKNVHEEIPYDSETYEAKYITPSKRLLAGKILNLACELRNEQCLKRSEQLLWSLTSDNIKHTKFINDIKVPLMCAMVETGDRGWQLALTTLMETKRRKTKEKLTEALSCTRSEHRMRSLLEDVMKQNNESVLDIRDLINNMQNPNHYCLLVELSYEKNKTDGELPEFFNQLPSASMPTKCKQLYYELRKSLPPSDDESNEQTDETVQHWVHLDVFDSWLRAEMEPLNSLSRTSRSFFDMYDQSVPDDISLDYTWQSGSFDSGNTIHDEQYNHSYTSTSQVLSPLSTLIQSTLFFILLAMQ